MWVASDPQGAIFYRWGVGRGCDQLVETIGEKFSRDIQCDGYVVYKTYAKTNPLVKLLARLAHIRRNFVEVLDVGPDPDAALILSLTGEPYGIEADLRAAGATPIHRHSQRAHCSAAIVGRIREVMEVAQARQRPASPMGKAFSMDSGIRQVWQVILRAGGLRPITTSPGTPCVHSDSAPRTGCSSGQKRRVTTPQ